MIEKGSISDCKKIPEKGSISAPPKPVDEKKDRYVVEKEKISIARRIVEITAVYLMFGLAIFSIILATADSKDVIDDLLKIHGALMNSWNVVLGGAITYLFMKKTDKSE